MQDIKKSFENVHLDVKIYWISSATLWNSTTVITVINTITIQSFLYKKDPQKTKLSKIFFNEWSCRYLQRKKADRLFQACKKRPSPIIKWLVQTSYFAYKWILNFAPKYYKLIFRNLSIRNSILYEKIPEPFLLWFTVWKLSWLFLINLISW